MAGLALYGKFGFSEAEFGFGVRSLDALLVSAAASFDRLRMRRFLDLGWGATLVRDPPMPDHPGLDPGSRAARGEASDEIPGRARDSRRQL